MELSLPPQLEEFVRAQVRSGRYADEQEVVRDALRQMRALVKAAEDPTVVGLVRDALGLATQAQREVAGMLQAADKEQSLFSDVLAHAGTVAGSAYGAVRKVPGARELDRIIRVPLGGMTFAAQQGELQAKSDARQPRNDREGTWDAHCRARTGERREQNGERHRDPAGEMRWPSTK